MALIVRVYINETLIIETDAQRIFGGVGKPCVYRTDTNHLISHHYDDGGAKLAIKLLEIYDKESS